MELLFEQTGMWLKQKPHVSYVLYQTQIKHIETNWNILYTFLIIYLPAEKKLAFLITDGVHYHESWASTATPGEWFFTPVQFPIWLLRWFDCCSMTFYSMVCKNPSILFLTSLMWVKSNTLEGSSVGLYIQIPPKVSHTQLSNLTLAVWHYTAKCKQAFFLGNGWQRLRLFEPLYVFPSN